MNLFIKKSKGKGVVQYDLIILDNHVLSDQPNKKVHRR
jgi:hypothetical protein